MKLSFDFQGMDKRKAFGIARHNERIEGFYEGNISGKGRGEIEPSRIKNNIVLAPIKSFEDKSWLSDVKVAGGRQKNANEFTGWVIQAGGTNNKKRKLDTLSHRENINFLTEAHEWIEKTFGKESIMGSVIQLDETTPQLQLVTNNKFTDEKSGKIYCSEKRKFGFVGLTKQQVREKSKKLQNKFYNEVAKKYGIEAPSKELGDRGKVSLVKYKLEINEKELKRKETFLSEKEQDVKIYEAFEKNNKNQKSIDQKALKALEVYNPKLAKAAKAAKISQVRKAKKVINKK